MSIQTQILQRLGQITAWMNQVKAGSKRIDELPDATAGDSYVAVWNPSANGGEGQTQKKSRESFVNQNNKGLRIGLPGFTSQTNSPIAECVVKVNTSQGFVVAEDEATIILTGIKFIVPPNAPPGPYNGTFIPSMRYTFLFLGGKGAWGSGGTPINSNMLYLTTPENIQVSDIQPGEDTQIIQLGDIGEDSDFAFLTAVNADAHDVSDPDVAYYFSYLVDDILYLVQFIGEPGDYGGETGNDFVIEDFAAITNSNTPPGPSGQSYDDVLGIGNITPRNAIHKIGTEQLLFGCFGFDYTLSAWTTSVGFRTPTSPGKIYFPANKVEKTLATLDDIIGFRLNAKQIIKIGKGYRESEEGYVYNDGPFELHEPGDFFASIDENGYVMLYMRYYGESTSTMPETLEYMAYEGRVKVRIPGEPGYEAPE